MSRISEVYPRYKAQKLDTGPASETTRFVNGQLTPELIDGLVRFKNMLIVDEVMEESAKGTWVQLEIPLALEKTFLDALEGKS